MKLNLCLIPQAPLNGYINVCASAQPHDKNFVYGDISNLDDFAEDGEAEEIRAFDVLSYFGPKEVDELLRRWIAKLKLGGTLTIAGYDGHLLGRALTYRKLDIADLQEAILGANGDRKSLLTLADMTTKLQGRNMKIAHKTIENEYLFVIKAERQ